MLSIPHSFWSVLLTSGEEYCEWNGCDWSKTLVETGKIHQIQELRLHCPTGQVAHLSVSFPSSAFQFKRAVFSHGMSRRVAHIIGRIDDRKTEACTAHIWDEERGLFLGFQTSFSAFSAWRDGIEAPGALSKQAQGMMV